MFSLVFVCSLSSWTVASRCRQLAFVVLDLCFPSSARFRCRGLCSSPRLFTARLWQGNYSLCCACCGPTYTPPLSAREEIGLAPWKIGRHDIFFQAPGVEVIRFIRHCVRMRSGSRFCVSFVKKEKKLRVVVCSCSGCSLCQFSDELELCFFTRSVCSLLHFALSPFVLSQAARSAATDMKICADIIMRA